MIQETQRPTLVLAHNKTLAAQLYSEFREFFPNNAVSYFVSYYDYYQPEAYVPRHDLYIEKETQINDEIDRLRLLATANLLSRRDVIIVASVSCIYGIGNPEAWGKVTVAIERGKSYRRNTLLRHLVDIQYDRNDMELRRGVFRVRGDTLQIFPAYAETAFGIEFWGDDVERITEFDPLTGEILLDHAKIEIFPASSSSPMRISSRPRFRILKKNCTNGSPSLSSATCSWKRSASSSARCTTWRCCARLAYTSGIENYSRHLDQRPAGSRPWTLIDYFPPDFLLVIDESHMTMPQVRGMYAGDQSRKKTLVDYGFRLPSAMDNRPLNFDEVQTLINQTIFTSATPGPYEMENSAQIVRQEIRPTGVLDPEVEVRPVRGQVDDLLGEINRRTETGPARPGHHADQAHGRGPQRLPAGDGRQGPLPAFGGAYHRAHGDPARPAHGRL